MKIFKFITISFIALFLFNSCKDDVNSKKQAMIYQCPMQCEGEITYDETGNCSICKMDLKPIQQTSKVMSDENEISEISIFNLTTNWNTEEENAIQLKELKGKTLVIVMIYTTCKAACPRLVADMRNIEKQIPEINLENVQWSNRSVPVGIDSEIDICTITFSIPIYISPPTKVRKMGVITNIITSSCHPNPNIY